MDVTECLEGGPGSPCDVVGHGYRERKTGPKFPIATRHCREHRCYYAVYPIGHVPYGQVAVAPVDASGFPLAAPLDGEVEEGSGWRGCLCEAAVEAARNRCWSREGADIEEAGEPGRYGTQRRGLRRCARLLGLAAELEQRAVERLRNFLGVDGLEHERLRRQWQTASRLSDRAQAVLAVLSAQPAEGDLWSRWLAAGALGGAWGAARIADPAAGRLLSPSTRLRTTGLAPP
ncbi:MAG: hypothetical protein GF330_08885 [Candidatus Eisenbacteria bacterium]|nr:hypothetical protein [Candidatus Eisenbacteria bacterium]